MEWSSEQVEMANSKAENEERGMYSSSSNRVLVEDILDQHAQAHHPTHLTLMSVIINSVPFRLHTQQHHIHC